MYIKVIENNGITIAAVEAEGVVIREVQDALDLMGDCSYQGANDIILHRKHLTPAFFDLSTGIAGEILQKFSNYRVRLAIVGDFTEGASRSLKDFIYESNKAGRVLFVNAIQEAMDKLTAN